MPVDNINDELEATITILLIFETAQNVSGNRLPIFKSVRLWLPTMMMHGQTQIKYSCTLHAREAGSERHYGRFSEKKEVHK